MKVIGMIGGLGPESTVEYYQQLIRAFRTSDSLAAPEIIIYSVSLEEVLDLVARRQWDHLVYLLVAKIRALHKAGADVAFISANTPHIVFNEVRSKSPIPLISIVTATLHQAKELGVKRVGLLGTKFTMEENFFSPPFAEEGIAVVVPPREDREYIHDKLMTEIELGIIREETRNGLLAVIERMVEREKVEAVILGCTELPLILDKDLCGVPFLDTLAIHVGVIAAYCRQ